QIVDCGVNLVCGTGNDDLYWTGSAWASTTGWVNNGYVGVTSFNSGNGVWGMTIASWNGNHTYTIGSEAINGAGTEPAKALLNFIVDNSAPSVTVSVPENRKYRKTLWTLSGTASDLTPGILDDVYFHAVRSDGKMWNWQTSTFTTPTNPVGPEN